MFWHEEIWIITLIILLIVYILEKSKHIITMLDKNGIYIQFLIELILFTTSEWEIQDA